jgi:hypothetical protein
MLSCLLSFRNIQRRGSLLITKYPVERNTYFQINAFFFKTVTTRYVNLIP